jgi:PAS domain S-box-containing protein
LAALVWRFFHHRSQAAALALRGQMQYRALFENGPCGMFIYDTRTQCFLAGNPVLAGMLGCTVEEIAQLSLRDLFPTQIAEDAAKELGSGELAPAQAHSLVTRMRRRDGTEIDVDIRGRPMDPKAGHSRVVMVIDVTEQLAAERGLREAEQRARNVSELLRSIIDVAPQAIVATDLEFNITMWNRAAETLFGWSASEVIGQQPPPMIPAEEEEAFHSRYDEIRATGNVKMNDITRLRKDGTRVNLIASGGLRRDASGEPAGFVMVYTDVTRYNAIEAQLRQSQKMEAVGRLAGGVAHDFNNMLTVIASYTQLLQGEYTDTKTAESLGAIRDATSRAAGLTRQLLTFSRSQIVQVAPVSLNDLIVDIQPMLRRVTSADIKFTTNLDPDVALVQVDGAQFEQVIVNLAVNAMDAMPNGGSLIVVTSNVRLDDDFARSHRDVVPGHYVMLAVTDTGIGMDGATISKIFEPFYTTKPAGRGTGLGLAIAYSVVKQAGGHIWVYSEPGQGTTFKIYLPRLAARGRSVTPVSLTAVVPKGGTVLLVEDDDAVRTSLRRTLERLGYTVLDAANGPAALAFIEENDVPIDAMLTDLMMPEMSGRELAERVKLRRPSVRILFMSGYTDDEVLRRQLVEEGQPFLQKPFTREQLVASIEG